MAVTCNYYSNLKVHGYDSRIKESITFNVISKAFVNNQLEKDAAFQHRVQIAMCVAAGILFAGGIATGMAFILLPDCGILATAACSTVSGVYGGTILTLPIFFASGDLAARLTSLPVCDSLKDDLNRRSVMTLHGRTAERSWEYLKRCHKFYEDSVLQIMESQILNQSRMEELRTAISQLGLER